MDSTIRLRQLNQAELSGFVSGVFDLLPKIDISGDIIPSGSGLFDLGSILYPYSEIFANQLNIASGSGVYFGNTPFRAYSSGGFAYVDIGGTVISSSGENIYIQGPSGVAGPSGGPGPTGISGVGITGISFDTSNQYLTFKYSNGTSTGFNFSGLSGSTGVSLTGFFRSGVYIYPLYDHHKGSGAGIKLLAGPPGPPGAVNIYFKASGDDFSTNGTHFPNKVIIDPYYETVAAPTISMQRGMVYTMDASGLRTNQFTADDISVFNLLFPDTAFPWTVGDEANFFKIGDQTGYWRFSLFPSGQATGYFTGDATSRPDVFGSASNTAAFYGTDIPNIYRTSISAAINFRAANNYKYGFRVYSLISEEQPTDEILGPTGYAYVLGNLSFASGTGPVGPPGPSSTVPGPRGDKGDIGDRGDDGAGITTYTYSGAGDNMYLRFILDNGGNQPWIPLPAGGPSGKDGAAGAVGSLINLFSGEYNPSRSYPTNTTISYTGSCFINSGTATVMGISPPLAPWMLIASGGASGAIGGIGPAGVTGPTGPAGTISNHFSGTWDNSKSYPNDYVVVLNGSSYVNTGSTSTPGVTPPNAPWQMLAQKGDVGTPGAAGLPGSPSLLRTSGIRLGIAYPGGNYTSDNVLLDPISTDVFTLTYSDSGMATAAGWQGSLITISGSPSAGVNHFETGKALIINIRNINVPQVPGTNANLFSFYPINITGYSAVIRWPNQQISMPASGKANVYTILRFADEDGYPAFYGTYSNPYSAINL